MDQPSAPLSTLPIRARPGYSLGVCLSGLRNGVARVHKSIRPPFYMRLLGGVSKDHARSVVATCNEDMAALLRATKQIQTICHSMSAQAESEERHRANALAGYCQRIISAVIDWTGSADDFQANIFGSERELVDQCRRAGRVFDNLVKPVEKLAE